jgi:hypothetical protein
MGTPRLEPIAWRLLLALAALSVAFHVVATVWFSWGYMTDELYFLDSVDRLACGFVDHPPLSIAVLRLVRDLLGPSQLAIRLLPALLGGATIVLCGLIAREMGGGRGAQGLAALAALCSPVYLVMGSYYSMNAFEQTLWPLGMFLLLRILNGGDARLWLVLGAVLAAAFLNKVSTLWFAAGIGVGLLLTPARRWLATPWPWVAGLMGLAGLVPFVWWQIAHGWPFVEFSRNAAQYKVGDVSLAAFVREQLLSMNVNGAPLWIGGVIYGLTSRRLSRYRPVAWIFVTVFALLASSGSARPHYLAPAYGAVFAFGAVGLEHLAAGRWWPTVVAGVVLLLGGVGGAPIAVPLLSPEQTIAYQNALGIRPREERERGGALPMHLALFFHAEAVLRGVEKVYESLTPADRARVEILTGSFGETGAIDVLGPARGLPRSIGTHNQYWMWGPGAATGDLMIVVHDSEQQLGQWFENCERRAEIDCPYCMEMMDAKAVFLCRGARRPLAEMWPEMKLYR